MTVDLTNPTVEKFFEKTLELDLISWVKKRGLFNKVHVLLLPHPLPCLLKFGNSIVMCTFYTFILRNIKKIVLYL